MTAPHEWQDGFVAPYPFVRCKAFVYDAEGGGEIDSWRPGVEFVEAAVSYYADPDSEAVADGVGSIVLRIVSTHKPAHYPERVFYVRQWQSPDGGELFGKAGLRVTTRAAFNRLCKGYRHAYRVREAAPPASQPLPADSVGGEG